MNPLFARNLKIVSVVHVAVIMGFVILPGLSWIFHREKNSGIPIELLVVPPPDEAGETGKEEARSEDIPPEPPKEEVKPDDIPLPPPKEEKEPPKKEKKKIEVSDKVIKKKKEPDKKKTTLSEAEIRRLLEMGARVGKPALSDNDLRRAMEEGVGNDPAFNLEEWRSLGLIKQKLYDAWAEPSRDEVGTSTAEGSLRFGLDGSIVDCKLSRKSGNAVLDDSVLAAMRSVKKIEGLTQEFLKKHKTVTIDFKVE